MNDESSQRVSRRNHRSIAVIAFGALIAGVAGLIAFDRDAGIVSTNAESGPGQLPDNTPGVKLGRDDNQESALANVQVPHERIDGRPPTTADSSPPLTPSRIGDGSERNRMLRLAAAADALASERSLLVGSSVSMAVVGPTLSGVDFDPLMKRLHSDAANDALALEVSRIYAETIRLQVSEIGGRVNLANFACGLKVCIGELSPGASNEDVSAWREVFDDDPRSPHSVFVGVPASIPEGRATFRFLFSFDPETRSLVVPPR